MWLRKVAAIFSQSLSDSESKSMSIIVWLFKTENQGHANLPTSSWLGICKCSQSGACCRSYFPPKTYYVWSQHVIWVRVTICLYYMCKKTFYIWYPKFGYITSHVASKIVKQDIWTTGMIFRGVYVTFQWLYNIGLVIYSISYITRYKPKRSYVTCHIWYVTTDWTFAYTTSL